MPKAEPSPPVDSSPQASFRFLGWLLGEMALLVLIGAAEAVLLDRWQHHNSAILFFDREYVSWAAVALLAGVLFLYRAHKHRESAFLFRQELRTRAAYEESRLRLREIRSLLSAASSFNVALPLHEMLEIVAQRIASSLKAQHVSIMTLDEGGRELHTAASYGVEAEFARDARQEVGKGIAGTVVETRKSRILRREVEKEDVPPGSRDTREISSSLCVPMLDGPRVAGVLNVNRINYPEDFGEDHLEMVEAFARQLGSMIETVRAADKIRSRTRNLEQELESAGLKVAELDRMRDLFLSTAGHELRTPVSVIQGAVDLLTELPDDDSAEERARELFQSIQKSCRQLNSLVTDIMDLVAVESGHVTLRPQLTDLNDLARAAVATLRPIAERYGIAIEENYRPGLPSIHVDRMKLRHPLMQLVSAVIRLTEDGGKVEIRSGEDDARVWLEIKGTAGMEASDIDRVLGLFGQTMLRSSKSVSGMGVGFELLKVILDVHGGRLEVGDVGGDGANFRVLLPKAGDILEIVSDAA
jgi:signal transduction histidine kinase